jgi:hypothetical protein
MPFAFEDIAVRSQVADNSADFMGGKSRIDRNREVVQPELCFEPPGPDVNMRRLAAFVRIEERPIGSPAQHGWHSVLVVRLLTEFRLLRSASAGKIQLKQLGERLFLRDIGRPVIGRRNGGIEITMGIG